MHFTHEDPEIQRGYVTCPRQQRQCWGESPGSLTVEPVILATVLEALVSPNHRANRNLSWSHHFPCIAPGLQPAHRKGLSLLLSPPASLALPWLPLTSPKDCHGSLPDSTPGLSSELRPPVLPSSTRASAVLNSRKGFAGEGDAALVSSQPFPGMRRRPPNGFPVTVNSSNNNRS